MTKHAVVVWVAFAFLLMIGMGALSSCSKEAFKQTPGTPKFTEAPGVVTEAEKEVPAERIPGVTLEERVVEMTEEERAAALREMELQELAERERRQLEEETARRERERTLMEEEERRKQEELAAAAPVREEIRKQFESLPVYFEFDSAVLSDQAKETLRAKAQFLSEHKSTKVIIEGHCDERGSVEYNLALGQRRAESAERYLVLLGVDSARLRTISYGKERPADPRHSEEAWAKNRRAEFILE